MNNISKIKTDLLMRKWPEMVRECRSSGLTVKEWCMDNDVNIKTYYYCLKRVWIFDISIKRTAEVWERAE